MTILLELAQQAGLEPKRVASTGGGEYKCGCPKCGGSKRFFIQPNHQMKNCVGRYQCRECGIKGDSIQFCRDILGLDWKESQKRCEASVPQSPLFSFERPTIAPIKPPPMKWQRAMERFVSYASLEIQKRSDVICWLESRGLSKQDLETYRIGFTENREDQFGAFRLPLSKFGLPEEKKEDGSPKNIWLPKGIVIPTLEPSGMIVRLKIRRTDWKPNDKLPKYAFITGSMGGMNLIGDRGKRVMIVVESELDAYALHSKVKDFAFVVAAGSNTKNPDNFSDLLAKSKQFLLICHDNDKGGSDMLDKWRNLYPHSIAHPTPIGKDIGEAVLKGLDLREWFLSALPKEFIQSKEESE